MNEENRTFKLNFMSQVLQMILTFPATLVRCTQDEKEASRSEPHVLSSVTDTRTFQS
jgi:hypothetical protein